MSASWWNHITGKVIQDTLSVDIKLNDEHQGFVIYNTPFEISWVSTGAINCAGFQHYVPVSDKNSENWKSLNTTGNLWTDLGNLPPRGSITLIADHLNFGYVSSLELGIQCFNKEGVSVSKILPVKVSKPIYIKREGCIKSPAYTEDLCNGYRLINSLEYSKECYSYDDCINLRGDGTCVRSPLSPTDLCNGYRVANINRACYNYEECINELNNTLPPTNNQTNDTSPYILPNHYSTISRCNPFLGNNDNPLKILFVNLGNAPYFEELKNDIINNQLKAITPFKENYNKMVFYSIEIDRSDEMNCEGHGVLSGSGFSCNNEKIYGEIEKQCTIDDKRGIITIVIGESGFGGSGGDIIYLGSSAERELNTQISLSKNVAIHEIGHNFGLADMYYGVFYFDGRPSQFWPTDFSRVFLNVDGPGCSKWCGGYKPVSEYTQSISSQCLKFTDKDSCTSFGRDSERSCTYSGEHPDCCVWSDEPFEYFNTNCVPAFGSEDIGINCFEGSGCYYGAVYGNYAWRPVLSQTDSIMFSLGSEKFSSYEENVLSNIFDCCLSDYSSNNECKTFRMDFSDLLQNYNWKKRIGSCGYKLIQDESIQMEKIPSENEEDNSSPIFIKDYPCDGCKLNESCYPLGYRKSGEYCFESKSFISQLEADSTCENNFECSSNLCIDGKCISSGLWQKFLNWLQKLFG